MPPLNKAQLDEFLKGGRLLMKLATLTPSGDPYVVPVWYEYDGTCFFVVGRPKNRWVAHLRQDPRVSACIDTCEAPYTRVLVQGTAEILDDHYRWTGLQRAIDYLGKERGRQYFQETKDIPRVLIRIRPSSIVSWSGGGWHRRYRSG
jgi:PPOX class probable F420-dependent enzyme